MLIRIQKKIILFVLIAFISSFASGCGNNSSSSGSEQPSPEAKQKQQDEQNKAPDELKKMESSLEKIIKSLDGPFVQTEPDKSKNEDSSEKSDQESDKESDKGSDSKEKIDNKNEKEGDSEKASGSKEQGSNNENKTTGNSSEKDASKAKTSGDTNKSEPFKKIESTVNGLHYQWNAFMPKATKNNAKKELIDGFGNSLDNLTDLIIGKNRNSILLAANMAYSYIPDFYALYKTEHSYEIKRIRYFIRNVILYGITSNWSQASKDMDNLNASWALYKNTLDKDQQDSAKKLEFSIYELEKVVIQKNPHLTDIKGRVGLANVALIEKSLEESKTTSK